jgi:hypothetical protein
MDTTNHSDNTNKPFSQRLIEDLRFWLETAFLFNGLHLDTVEMDPVEDDEEIESIFGSEFVFTIRATAYLCSPKGTGPADSDKQEDPQKG